MRATPLQKILHIESAAGRMLAVLAALVLTNAAALVQAPAQVPGYNAGAAAQQATPPKTPAQKASPSAAVPIIIQEEEKPLTLKEGEKLFVKDFKIDGAEAADKTNLDKLLAPYKNKELTMKDIIEAANHLTLYYRNKGSLVAKAYVPQQNASDGILLIKVVIGKYGKFTMKNSSHVRDWYLQGVFETATKNKPAVTRDSLERAMLLVRDLPGSKLPMVSIRPGTTTGTSDFDVNVDSARRINGYLMGDNQGSRYTGTKRLYGGITINSPFGIADKFSVSTMTSEAMGLRNLLASYSAPLTYSGLRLQLSAGKTAYTLGGPYHDLNATGLVDSMDATLSYPFKRNRVENIDASVNFARKWLRDDIATTSSLNRRSATVATLSAQRQAFGHLFGRNVFSTLGGSVNIGNINPNAVTEKGTPTGIYSKLNLSASDNMSINNKLTAVGSLKLQKALTGGTLDSSEQMFLSGTGEVRSFTEGVGGDNGYVLNLEGKYALPSVAEFKHAVGVFVDNGGTYAQHSSYSLNDKIMVSDVGGAYYANYKMLFASVQLAQSIGSYSYNSEKSSTRFFFQAGMTF